MQTDDFRYGLTEGVITCYLAEFLDADEFWYVIDSYIHADHAAVIQRIKASSEWLDFPKQYELFIACPSYGGQVRDNDDCEELTGFGNINSLNLALGYEADVKDIGEDLNTCERCGDIHNTFNDMYWAGEECMETNILLGDYDCLCDDCFESPLRRKLQEAEEA